MLFYLLTCVAVEVLMEEMGFFEKPSDHTLELARFLLKGKSEQIVVCFQKQSQTTENKAQPKPGLQKKKRKKTIKEGD